jgi:hypothetical protein
MGVALIVLAVAGVSLAPPEAPPMAVQVDTAVWERPYTEPVSWLWSVAYQSAEAEGWIFDAHTPRDLPARLLASRGSVSLGAHLPSGQRLQIQFEHNEYAGSVRMERSQDLLSYEECMGRRITRNCSFELREAAIERGKVRERLGGVIRFHVTGGEDALGALRRGLGEGLAESRPTLYQGFVKEETAWAAATVNGFSEELSRQRVADQERTEKASRQQRVANQRTRDSNSTSEGDAWRAEYRARYLLCLGAEIAAGRAGTSCMSSERPPVRAGMSSSERSRIAAAGALTDLGVRIADPTGTQSRGATTSGGRNSGLEAQFVDGIDAGFNRICFYGRAGDIDALTIKSVEICPLLMSLTGTVTVGGMVTTRGFLKEAVERGQAKVCVYDRGGSLSTLTVRRSEICPPQVR